jgi:PAS domain S-box-containing protein
VRMRHEPTPALFDAAADCLALIDDQAVLRYTTAAVQRLFGYTVDELLGRNVLEFVHPDDLPAVADAMVTTLATPGIKSPLELRVRRADDRWLPVEIVSNNMLGEPSVGGIVVTIRDRSRATLDPAA